VRLLPRRPAADPELDGADSDAETFAGVGKGRPTPKRRDSVSRRGPVTAPKTRKEAAARQRQLAREQRSAAKSAPAKTPAERRAALRSGAVLSRRDQGPTRKLARDYVDSHRMLSNYLLLLFPLMIVSYVVPMMQLVVLGTFLALLVEWYLVGRRIRALAIERFGSADGGNLSIGFYAGSRAYLPRRWRLPAPEVQLGEAI
jgi:Protein of unknown function (DUF3043)